MAGERGTTGDVKLDVLGEVAERSVPVADLGGGEVVAHQLAGSHGGAVSRIGAGGLASARARGEDRAMTPARTRAVVVAALRLRRRRGRAGRDERPRGRGGRVGGLRAARDVELRRHRPVRLAAPAGEPHGRADGGARLRLVPRRAQLLERAAAVHGRADRGRALGRGVPAARDGVPVGPACAGARPRDRDRGLPDLHAGLDPGACCSRARRSSAATTARPTCS